MRHEVVMRDQFKPCECERRVCNWAEFFKELGHVIEDQSLSPHIEAVRDIYRSQNVHEHATVWLLVEVFQLIFVVLPQLNLDELEDLAHEFLLVKLRSV